MKVRPVESVSSDGRGAMAVSASAMVLARIDVSEEVETDPRLNVSFLSGTIRSAWSKQKEPRVGDEFRKTFLSVE